MNSNLIRSNFIKFFEEKGHSFIQSSSIVAKNDPSLMFTNAGMNQFKNIFLGNESSKVKRVANSQKCLRVSGKHNDLEKLVLITTIIPCLKCWVIGVLAIILKKRLSIGV